MQPALSQFCIVPPPSCFGPSHTDRRWWIKRGESAPAGRSKCSEQRPHSARVRTVSLHLSAGGKQQQFEVDTTSVISQINLFLYRQACVLCLEMPFCCFSFLHKKRKNKDLKKKNESRWGRQRRFCAQNNRTSCFFSPVNWAKGESQSVRLLHYKHRSGGKPCITFGTRKQLLLCCWGFFFSQKFL